MRPNRPATEVGDVPFVGWRFDEHPVTRLLQCKVRSLPARHDGAFRIGFVGTGDGS